MLGELDGHYILASETCALDIIGARFVRDVENGEIVVISDDGHREPQARSRRSQMRPCIFEYIYFARPDSVVHGRPVYDVRKRMGAQLAREIAGRRRRRRAGARFRRARGDRLSPRQSGIPFELGIIRNHYVGRTFIQPTQSIRDLGVRLKHNANRCVVEGKRIVLVDDSIVRGTTSVKIVQMMREAGASEVHFRIASPPITHPDFYGIDTPEHEQAARRAATDGMIARGDAQVHRRRLARLPVGRRPLPRHGRRGPRRRSARNSPTIASPATIRPR